MSFFIYFCILGLAFFSSVAPNPIDIRVDAEDVSVRNNGQMNDMDCLNGNCITASTVHQPNAVKNPSLKTLDSSMGTKPNDNISEETGKMKNDCLNRDCEQLIGSIQELNPESDGLGKISTVFNIRDDAFYETPTDQIVSNKCSDENCKTTSRSETDVKTMKDEEIKYMDAELSKFINSMNLAQSTDATEIKRPFNYIKSTLSSIVSKATNQRQLLKNSDSTRPSHPTKSNWPIHFTKHNHYYPNSFKSNRNIPTVHCLNRNCPRTVANPTVTSNNMISVTSDFVIEPLYIKLSINNHTNITCLNSSLCGMSLSQDIPTPNHGDANINANVSFRVKEIGEQGERHDVHVLMDMSTSNISASADKNLRNIFTETKLTIETKFFSDKEKTKKLSDVKLSMAMDVASSNIHSADKTDDYPLKRFKLVKAILPKAMQQLSDATILQKAMLVGGG